MTGKPLPIQVRSPGKLILSGEHAVVYGHPALAMAVNRYVTASISHELLPRILFDLADLAHRSHISLDGLRKLKERVKRKYHRFIRGDYSIRQVIQKPFELAQFAMGTVAESMNVSMPQGAKIRIHSTIPVGCGMGSSAATILSVMSAVSHYLQTPLTPELLFKLSLEAENMQHGHSSGLDLRIAMQGGCLFMEGGAVEPRQLPALNMCLVNTGTPLSTTGECVQAAASHFQSGSMGEAFAAVTRSMDRAIWANDLEAIQSAIRENHQLLVRIGVVPASVQTFIGKIEELGAAAKICGAGAVTGERAGMVLIAAHDLNTISSYCEKAGFQMMAINGESRGVHVV